MSSKFPGKNRKKNSQANSTPLLFEAIEPRILFSGTPLDLPADTTSQEPSIAQDERLFDLGSTDLTEPQVSAPLENGILEGLNHRAADLEGTGRRELVFVAGDLSDQAYIESHLDPAFEIHIIKPGSDGVRQIAEVLAGRTGIDALHIISHGDEGRLYLGDATLDVSSMNGKHGDLLREIGASLSDKADLLIYGCEFSHGESGDAASRLLSQITGADVAASDDNTGHTDLGGDWLLETTVGEIDADTLALSDWQGLLAAPSVSVPSGEITTLEDQVIVFNGGNTISVGSDTYTELSVTLTVGQGSLTLADTTGLVFLNGTMNGGSSLEIQGSVTDLNTALAGLTFTPAQDSHGSETLTVAAVDPDTTTSADVSIAIVSQNDAPVLVVNPINASATGTPSETASHTFGLADIEAVDPDNSNNQLTYIIESLPANGSLRLNGHPVTAGSIFTQSALASGALVYIHNGGENHSDSFVLTVNDGAGGSDTNVLIPITITPVNDGMSVSSQAVVYEGGATSDGAVAPGKPVPVLSLSIGDEEADAKTVTITSLPGGGTLYYNGSAITQTMVNGGFSFSAANFALLEYVHDGVDDLGTSPSNRSFNIRVVDQGGGAGAGAIQTVNHTVNITVVGVNDELELVNLSSAVPTIASGNSYVLGLSDIEVNDPDGPNARITYTLQSSPLHGLLYIAGQRAGAGATFTQAELAAGQVVFTNGGVNALDSLFLKATDSEISILTDELGTVRVGDHTTAARILELRFQLTAGTGGGGTLIRLNEGAQSALSGAVPGDVISLNSGPAHGSVLVNGNALSTGSPYTLQAGDTITYQHDGTHTDADSFIWIVNGDTRSVTVEVLLTNDAPVLTIVAPLTGVHEGFSGTITTANLQVTDEETTNPANLVYTVTGSPSGGTLLKNGVAIPAFGTFSQQDVIDGLISYQHNGSEKFLDGVTLSVSDGSATDSDTLPIQITPVNDQPSVTANFMELLEGETKAFTASLLGVSDVDGVGADIPLAQDSPLQIRIDALPAHGSLFYNDPVLGMTAVTSGFIFNHSDIGRLSYQHDSSENFSDTFAFTVIDNNAYNNPGFDAPGTRAGTMNIGVIPVNDAPAVNVNTGLISDGNGDRRVYEGGVRILTTSVLSSVDPDSTTEQVQYRITAAPLNGTLLLNGVPVAAGTAFTQADLADGRLSYRHNGSETSTDSFRFRIDDGASNVAETTFQIGIIAVNDAPVISAPSDATINTADYHFTGPRTISVAESDSGAGNITVTLGVSDPGGMLRVTSSTGLASVSGTDTDTLVLVGKASDINAALATLHYRATDLDGAATLTIHVNDGGNTGVDPSSVPFGEIPGLVNTGTNIDEQATRVVNLLVSPIDDAPVHTIPGAQTAYEDVTFTFSSANGNAIALGDVDAFGGQMEVTLAVANGKLTLGTTAGLTFSSGDGTSDASMTFRGTVSAINAALEGLRYLGNSNFEGSETLSITTSDLGNTGDGGPLSDSDTVSINVIGVNDTPVIGGPASTVLVNAETFTFNGANTISVSDSDVAGGLVTVTVTVADAGGILEVTQTTGLSAVSGNGSSNVLAFTGTLADVNAALATLSYSANDINGTTTLTVLVSDNGNTGVDPSVIGLPNTGTASDEQRTRVFNLLVSDVNDAPVNSLPGAQSVNEDIFLTFNTANGNAVSISDADAFSGVVTTTVSVLHGTLQAGGSTAQRSALASLTGNNSNTLTLSGTVAQINAVLQGMRYLGSSNYNGAETLTIVTNDNGNTGIGGAKSDTDSVDITVAAVNDAPAFTTPAAQSVQEDNTLVFSTANGNAISLSDVDAAEGTGLLTATVSVTNGTLSLSGIGGLTFGSGDGTADVSMTFTGTAASINAALNGLAYNPTADYNGSAVLSISVSDNGNTGAGNILTDSETVDITVQSVADIVADSVGTLEDTPVTFDVIAGTNGASADDFEGTPLISAINGTAVSAGSTVTVANGSVKVNATSGELLFTPDSNYNGTTTFNYTVTSPSGVTEVAQVTVVVQAVNDAPVITVPGAQTFNEDVARLFNVANGNVISIADVDSATGDVTTTITATNGRLQAGGTTTQRTALTSLTGNNTKTLVLTGTVAEINAVLLGLRYTPDTNYNGSDTISIVTNDLGNTGSGGPLSDSESIALTINAVNDAPVNTVPSARTIAEDATLVFSAANGNAITVGDVDVAEGTGNLTVTLGVTNGTLTLSTLSGLSFSTGDGTADATMTFSGTAAEINAALNGLAFNPTADYNGSAQLTLLTSDNGNTGSGGTRTDSDTVAITITPVVDVVNDVLVTDEDVSINFNVLTGTGDAEADSFSNPGQAITAHTQPAHGVVTVQSNGDVSYTPDANWFGVDTFQYTVTSGGVTETATVTITVNSVNDAPVAVNDGFTVPEDGSVTIDVLDDDYDVDGDSLTITHVDGHEIFEGGPAVTVLNGTVTLVGGKLVYTPTPDYFGTASFEYTISDGALSSTATVSGSVTATPRTLTIADVSTDEDNNLVFTVVLNKSTASAFTVEVSTLAGSATGGGVDYTTLDGHSLSFAGLKGESVTFTVAVNADMLIENDEMLTVVLGDISIADVDITDTATGTIIDNDARLTPTVPGEGVTTDIELVSNGSGGFDLVIEDVETDSPIGFGSDVPVSDSGDNLIIYRDGSDYVIRDTGGLWLGSPIIGATRGASNEIRVPVALVTGNIIVRTGTGDDVVTVRDLGTALSGGLEVDLEDGSGRYLDTDTINYDSSTALAAGANAQLRAETINGLSGSGLTASGSGTIHLDAGRNIFLDDNARLASGSGAITLEANVDGVVLGRYQGIVLEGAEVESQSGSVRLEGRGGTEQDRNYGVVLSKGSLLEAGGALEVIGTGGGDGSAAAQLGLLITSSEVRATGSGGLSLQGSGGTGTQYAPGVTIEKNSVIDGGSGAVLIEGTGGTGGSNNYGVSVAGSRVETAGGDIQILGTGDGVNSGIGVLIGGGSVTTNADGSITVRGTGATGLSGNEGVRFQAETSVTAEDGDVLIAGIASGTEARNYGVSILGNSKVDTTSGDGLITVQGTGGFGIGGEGIVINTGSLAVGDGDLAISGTGRGAAYGRGVELIKAALQSGGTGNISVDGTGSASGSGDHNTGILGNGSSISATGTGAVVLQGTGGTGLAFNDGVQFSATRVEGAVSILITGVARGTSGNSSGVALERGTLVAGTGNAPVTVNGTASTSGAATGLYHRGVEVSGSTVSTVNGDLTLRGTGGGAGMGTLNRGIDLLNAVVQASGSGNLVLSGNGARNGSGIQASRATVLSSAGNVSMTGNGGVGSKNTRGVNLIRSTLRSTGGGDVTLRGTAHPNTTGTGNAGVYIDIATLGTAGQFRVIGTGGGGNGKNHGVFMNKITRLGSAIAVNGTITDDHAKTFRTAGNYFA